MSGNRRSATAAMNRPYCPGRCEACGKMCWLSRDDGKWVRRDMHEPGLAVYRCGDYWHVGHLTDADRP